MARLFPPPAMKPLVGGCDMVEIEAKNVRQLIERLEEEFPGARERLVENGELRSGLAVVVNGHASSLGLLQQLEADDEVHFLPALGGG